MSGFISSASTEAIADECAKIEPHQLIVHIHNNTTEKEVYEFFTGLGIVLENLESNELVVSVELLPEEFEQLKNDPYVNKITPGKPENFLKKYTMYFTKQVKNQYAFDLLNSISEFIIKRKERREPREATIIVPEGEEEQWLEQLRTYPNVLDVSRKCYSTYYLTCEQYGGTITKRAYYSSERCVNLPLPEINWDEVLHDEALECERVNGTWTKYNSTCQDECSFLINQDRACGMALTEGCSCGSDRCMVYRNPDADGRVWEHTCIDIPEWHQKYIPDYHRKIEDVP